MNLYLSKKRIYSHDRTTGLAIGWLKEEISAVVHYQLL